MIKASKNKKIEYPIASQCLREKVLFFKVTSYLNELKIYLINLRNLIISFHTIWNG